MSDWHQTPAGLYVPFEVRALKPAPPAPPPQTFPVLVTLRDTRDGFARTIEKEWRTNWADPRWCYREGNDSCDCNRSRQLYPDDPSKWVDCGETVIELIGLTAGDVPCGAR